MIYADKLKNSTENSMPMRCGTQSVSTFVQFVWLKTITMNWLLTNIV